MSESSLAEHRSILECSPAERDEQAIETSEIQEALVTVIRNGQGETKVFEGQTFPKLTLDYQVIEGADNHPVVFRDCTFEEGISIDNADIKLPLLFEDCEIGGCSFEYVRFEHDVEFDGSTITGPVDAYESQFDRDASFPNVTFEDEVLFEECSLDDDTSFAGAQFLQDCSFRGTEFAGVSNLLNDNADFSGVMFAETASFEQSVFQYTTFETATFQGQAVFEEAVFEGDAVFVGADFEQEADFDEIECHEDMSFEQTTFDGLAHFRGALFKGGTRTMDDDVRFADATFSGECDFSDAHFRGANFKRAVFEGATAFEETRFDGDVSFQETTFDSDAHFEELRCHEDAVFEDVTISGPASFCGAIFSGGARTIEDDVRFVGAVFEDTAEFSDVEFRYANFSDVTFEADAIFREAWFEADCDFNDTVFEANATFEETRFAEDADFSACRFRSAAIFCGAEFHGDANQLEDNASFESAVFESEADFSDTKFTSANFMQTRFDSTIEFTSATFTDRIDLFVRDAVDNQYANFTDATIKGGTIVQPENGWVHYDFTRASVGDIDLRSHGDRGSKELLDYFRFCLTVFDEFDGDEFDFSSHTDYLDRNNWNLHDFDDPIDREYAVEMTPETIETTYLKAKNSASAAGDMKAAGEFRVKRQQFARKKHFSIATDPTADTNSRLKNGIRAAENAFLGVACGHGIRLFRIFAVFAIIPVFFAVAYAFGPSQLETGAGQLESLSALTTPAGQQIFYENLHFSYITYLTIGYGNIGPKGWAARFLAGTEVYFNVILAGLVLYALIKRSEM